MEKHSEPDESGPVPSTGITSVALLRRARRGDTEALDRLFRRYRSLLQRWASGRLPPWARGSLDTEDLVQETLVRTFQHVREFEPRRDHGLHLYLREALRNRIRDEVRRARRGPGEMLEVDDRAPAAEPSPLDEAIGEEMWERYEAALAELPEPERALLVARIDFGMSYREIAEMSDKPSEDAARMAVSRALVKIARVMGKHG